jgi:hypothetical protein
MMLVFERLSTYTAGKFSASCVVGEHMPLKTIHIDESLPAYFAYLSKVKLEDALFFAPTKGAVVTLRCYLWHYFGG